MSISVALCFIISYEHVLQKEQFWINWIEPNKDIINVYFHYKDKKKIKSKWILNNCIPEKFIKQTSYYDVVPAYIALLTYAFFNNIKNQWFCLLTDSCIPIISPQDFRNLFLTYHNKSIIKCGKAHWNVDYHRRANLRLLDKKYHLCNDPWFTLCRYHVQLCNIFLTAKNDVYKTINNGGLANESLFAVILETFNEIQKNKKNKDRLINESSTISDWSRMSTPTSPHLFNEYKEEDKNIIKLLIENNKYSMFLRKVNYKFPDEALLEIIKNNNKKNKIQLVEQHDINYKKYLKKYIFYFLFFYIFLKISFYLQYFLQ